jgi:glycosyltransferase involved in cell wall biosynthesis
MRSRGVAVIDDLGRLGSPPDVIHGQHHGVAMEAMLRFPKVPALFVGHGWLPWQEAPPRFPSLLRYVAVDTLRRDRLVLEHGIPEDKVAILPNFVDLDRFRPRPPLPPKPQRALLFSNHGGPHTYAPAVEEACARAGIELTAIGRAAGRELARPETVLSGFDLVFARGRAALEAMAVGAAVVLCDVEGAGPLVGPANFDGLRALNFGLGALRPPVEPDRLLAEIRRYDPEDAAKVQDRVRREAGRREAVESLVRLYRQIREEGASLQGEQHTRACLDAAASYLSWLGPTFERTQDELLSTREDLHRNGQELAATRGTLEALESSPFSRLRARLLSWRPLVSAYRAFKRTRATVEDGPHGRNPVLSTRPGNVSES